MAHFAVSTVVSVENIFMNYHTYTSSILTDLVIFQGTILLNTIYCVHLTIEEYMTALRVEDDLRNRKEAARLASNTAH